MALTPKNPQSDAEKREQRKSSEQDALLREVDEAYRQDQFTTFAQKYGKLVVGVIVAGLLAFGGGLWWYENRESGFERSSEDLVRAIDHLEAGNFDTAAEALAKLEEEGGPGAATVAMMTRAALALEQDRLDEAERLYAAVAEHRNAPQVYRDLATIREVSLRYEKMQPADVIARIQPLAKPGLPFFGSAGELLGAAYLDQDRTDLAGPLFAEIAKDETVPETLRSRARQLAGLMGVDAIDDVDKTLQDLRAQGEAAQ